MSKLILIDGNAILHRAYHALPPLTTKKGEPINAVYGLVSMLLRVIQDMKPTHIAVCFDTPEPTFRHKEFPEYQAQRPKTADELSSQFEKAKRVIEAFGIPIFEKAGYEADDVLGTLALQVSEKSNVKSQMSKVDDVVIVTGDRDILQLVNDYTKVYLMGRGMTEGKLYAEKDVVEKMGIEPAAVADYKALVGDPADNYRGVSGIGPKTAIALLQKYKNLDEIYTHLNEVTPKIREKLRGAKEAAHLSLKLARIVKDVGVSLDLENCGRWDVDSQRVLDLFTEFGFRTLTERVKKVGQGLDKEKQMALL